MKRIASIVLILFAMAAVACEPSLASSPPLPDPPSPVPGVPSEFVPSPIPVTPTFDGCYYTWASQNLPELTRKLNASLQDLGPDLTAFAYAYGEDCTYADGHSTFSAMETDFRVGVQVASITDEAIMGDWIYKIMQVIVAIPQDELQGPNPGTVEFDFKQPDPAQTIVRVPISIYLTQAQKLRGAELFRFFKNNP